LTVAAFMDLALYDADLGYYARAPRRSGRAGDFFTSVDVGPIFGDLLERQIDEMAAILDRPASNPPRAPLESSGIDLVDAGAGNGQLAADILRAARRRDPRVADRLTVHLVETSAEARDAQPQTLGDVADRLASSSAALPDRFEGVLIANELLDALPVHQVVMREDGLREVYVGSGPVEGDGLTLVEGPPSTPALAEYLARLRVDLEPGWRVEINLRALDWIRVAAERLIRGFVILIDYGHEARELYSPTHAGGTLTTFSSHTMAGPEAPGVPSWLRHAGEQDITAHVDFTSVRAAAEAAGLDTIAFMDQTYFLLGLAGGREYFSAGDEQKQPGKQPIAGTGGQTGNDSRPLFQRGFRTLIMPGGLGSTHKVLILGKGVGRPALKGTSFGGRVT
jgi:SAM-dependent MidA family methyltransferase